MLNPILYPFRRLRDYLRLREAARQAERAHLADGERYYVVPAAGGTKLLIMSRRHFRRLKQKGYITHRAAVRDLERECFYCTAYRNGEGALPTAVRRMKRQQYHTWMDTLRTKKPHEPLRKH